MVSRSSGCPLIVVAISFPEYEEITALVTLKILASVTLVILFAVFIFNLSKVQPLS